MKLFKSLNQLEIHLLLHRTIDVTTGCWLWNGSLTNVGYGEVSHRNKKTVAHRIAAHVWLGFDLDSDLQVNHKNICPNRHCFNPEHIYVGTHTDNMNDVKSKYPTCKICGGLKMGKHRRANGTTSKECIICRHRQQREYRQRRKNVTLSDT